MGLSLVGQMIDAVRGLDILGWVRNIEASDADPALTVKQNGAGSVGAKLVAGVASAKPLTIKGAAGQSANLMEVLNSIENTKVKVSELYRIELLHSDGTLLISLRSNDGGMNEQAYFTTFDGAVVPVGVKAKAGQTAALQVWKDTADAVLAQVLVTGEVVSTVALRTKHEGASTPTGGASGDIRVGNGKI